MRRIVLAFALATTSGCATRVLHGDAPQHGNLAAAAALHETDEAAQTSVAAALPLVVLIERAQVVAVDPIHGKQRWSLPLVVTGQPVASAHTVYLPVRGRGIVAVDRTRGTVRFTAQLPGEALTGLAVCEPMLVATVIDPDGRHPAQIVGVSTIDGDIRWRRPATDKMGIPEVTGAIAVVGIGRQAVALQLETGREVARIDVAGAHDRRAELERVVHRRGMWFVGSGTRWVDLAASQPEDAQHGLARSYAPAFRTHDGIDDGHGDDERLRLWLRWSTVDASPRDAILMARRAVISARLDSRGQPLRPRWSHVEPDAELVAMEVSGNRVLLVREDGGLVEIDDDDGRVLRRIGGGAPVRGALVLAGGERAIASPKRRDDPRVVADLVDLLAHDDERLLPAQRFAADLLWRSDDPDVRATVWRLAAADAHVGPLGDHARALVRTPWGSRSDAEASELLTTLRARPRFGRPEHAVPSSADVDFAITRATGSGSPDVVLALGELLLAPTTRGDQLVQIIDVLAKLGDVRGYEPVAAFLMRYHADAEIVGESDAVHAAARLLLAQAEHPVFGPRSQQVLEIVATDPLSAASLRTVVVHARPDAARVR
jgi:uncharacterized protein YceK